MRACSGASQSGNAPAKCSIRMPMNRSMQPNGARWIITGRCGLLSAPMYSSSNRFGQVVIELHGAELPLAADAVA